jgi:Protein of unknown function (DUF3631)/Domain of unknown function (DUF3854)
MSQASDYLLVRGITQQTASQNRLEFDIAPLDQKRIISRLNPGCVPLWALAQELLWFPVRSNGSVPSWITRPFPRLVNGPKFVTPKGGIAPPFVPFGVPGLAHGLPLIITEGPVKALAATQAGVAALGLNGVWCASSQAAGGKLMLRAEITSLCDLRGRKSYVAFDADAAIKPDVRTASIRLFLLLYQAGAEVFQLTSWDISEGKGLDDFLVHAVRADPQSTPESVLAMLIADATPFLDSVTKSGVDTRAVETELGKVLLSDFYRDQLCHEFASRLGVKVELLRAIGRSQNKNSVIFSPAPQPWPNPVDGETLLHDISALIKRHVVLDNDDVVTVTLWIVLSYLVEAVDVLPILGIVSPEKRCGKTRLLTILSRLVHQALPCSSISAASIYRVIEKFCPTLLVDEADSFLKDNEQLRGVINSGHTRGTAFAIRINPNTMEPERFSTWGPKAIALIGKLPGTITDRSLLVSMVRRKRSEKVLPLRNTPLTDYEELRRKILRWVEDNKVAIASLEPQFPPILNDRATDNWLPLLAIAQTAGQTWRDLAITTITKASTDNGEESVTDLLLSCLRKLFRHRRVAFLSTSDILAVLNAYTEMPWVDWRNGKGLSAQKLRSMLADFKIRSVQLQIQGQRARGYLWSDLLPAFQRYL